MIEYHHLDVPQCDTVEAEVTTVPSLAGTELFVAGACIDEGHRNHNISNDIATSHLGARSARLTKICTEMPLEVPTRFIH